MVVFGVGALIAPAFAQVTNSGATVTAHDCLPGPTCVSFAQTTGVADPSEPSGMAPPSIDAIVGYHQTYATDFPGSSLPGGWSTFLGTPGGDPGTAWAATQVIVSNGELQLNAAFDSKSNQWITGGACDCSRYQTYGAYFVRSRMTGPGATVVESLWPVNGWPPEIDFNETFGDTAATMGTVHYGGSSNLTDHRTLSIDMTLWHTWGVVWSPTTIYYTVDGNVWGEVDATNEIPNQDMTLDIQQQTWCSSGFACPTAPQSTLVDWVAVYSPGSVPTPSTTTSTTTTTTTMPAPVLVTTTTGAPVVKSASPNTKISIEADLPVPRLAVAVRSAALTIFRRHAHTVTVMAPASGQLAASSRRVKLVHQVETMLATDVRNLGSSAPRIFVRWAKSSKAARLSFDILLTVSP